MASIAFDSTSDKGSPLSVQRQCGGGSWHPVRPSRLQASWLGPQSGHAALLSVAPRDSNRTKKTSGAVLSAFPDVLEPWRSVWAAHPAERPPTPRAKETSSKTISDFM